MRLGLEPQTLDQTLAENRLFTLEVDGVPHFPAFYADPCLDRQQLEQVCQAMGGLGGGSKWQFFTRPKGSLGGQTPLEALRAGQFEVVERSAYGFAER